MEKEFLIQLPAWIEQMTADRNIFETLEDRMRFVIELSGRNIRERTGGPFGAAVFDENTDQLVSVGVNLVADSGLSVAHAEIAALSLAQKRIGSPRLKNCVLYSSCEPCAMCLGAIPWSGVCGLVYGASEADARKIGFDEGDKPEQWPEKLQQKGIEVIRDVLRPEARQVLIDYKNMGGIIY